MGKPKRLSVILGGRGSVRAHSPRGSHGGSLSRNCASRFGVLAAVVWLAMLMSLAPRANAAAAPEMVEVLPLCDRVLMLHFDEGHVVHHRRGTPRSDEQVIASPLDIAAASRPTTYRVRSADDPAYKIARPPVTVGRKSKGTDFAWFVDRWENGHAVNTRPDHAKEHWLYLELPAPLRLGKTYTVSTSALAANGREWTFVFSPAKMRSEAVHVNVLGYVPAAPRKYAYIYHWMGDRGSLDVRSYVGRTFRLIDEATGATSFTGKLAFRAGQSAGDSPQYRLAARRQFPQGRR